MSVTVCKTEKILDECDSVCKKTKKKLDECDSVCKTEKILDEGDSVQNREDTR